MNKKTINTFITYTVKKPVIFVSMIILGVLCILYMALATKTNIIKTYDVLNC